MKKMLLLLMGVMLVCGCGNKDNTVKLAIEEGYDCPKAVLEALYDYYEGREITVTEVKQSDLTSDKYDAAAGGVNMTSSLGYGLWKSSVIKYENACAAGYDDYRFSDDFSGKRAGVPAEFNYSRYITIVEGCEYTTYKNTEDILSDLKAGAIDAAVCDTETAAELKEADSSLRVNDILESNIYEYVVLSRDIDLINSLDDIIGEGM
ncbi:MAG: transporter substrate-binding domain-containing protein [Clostridiales bacterium]|nr:transporter substrate-binding domain-containing protein [Clostridiales bacterium]